MDWKAIPWIRKAVLLWRNCLERHSFCSGKDNKVINHGGVKVHARIQIKGSGNRLVLEKGSLLKNATVKILGSGNEVILKAGAYVSGAEIWVQDNGCRVEVGERTFIGHHSHLACTEDGNRLVIGPDCLLSSYVQVRTGDSHSILGPDGGRINGGAPVVIGPHCWIGEGAKVLKGVTLEGDDVVATGAIVTASFGPKVLLGGVPAKVLKEDITWDSKR